MAVVGHAYVVVRAITDSVADDIRKSFSGSAISKESEKGGKRLSNSFLSGLMSGMEPVDNAMTRAAGSFRKLHPEADKLRNAFTGAMRAGYLMQGGLGQLLGGVSSLIGGLGALAGAAGGASAALVAVGSAAITAKVGMGIAQFALGGIGAAVSQATKATGGYAKANEDLREKLQQLRFDQDEAAISVDRAGLNLEKARQNMLRTADLAPNSLARRDAEIAFREADLAFRKAKDRQNDLKEGQKEEDKPKGGSDPFANLTPSQKAFAKYLVSINDKFKELKESAASGFLPVLQGQIERLINSPLLGILNTNFKQIGRGAGLAVQRFVDVFLSGNNVANFNIALGNMAAILPRFGTIFGNIFDGLLSVLTAVDPLTRKFVGFLESKSGAFADFLDTKNATGELTAFFDRAGEIAAKFGEIFGNVFDGLGDIIAANFGPGSGGDRMLDFFIEATDGFANMNEMGLDIYFQKVADNTIAILSTLGRIFEVFVQIGADPAIKGFWDALDSAVPDIKTLMSEAVKAGEPLGKLLASVISIFAAFSDSGQPIAFFETLAYVANGVAEALNAIKPALDFIGPLLGTLSALGLLVGIFSKLILVGGSFAAMIVQAIGSLVGLSAASTSATIASGGLSAGIKAVNASMLTFMATNPIGWAMAAVAAIAAIGIAIANIHGERMDKAVKGIDAAFTEGANSMDTFKQAMNNVTATDDFDYILSSSENLHSTFEDLGGAQESFWGALTESSGATTALADSLGAVGRSLANTATTNLPKAQSNFKKFTKEMGLSREEMVISLDEMDEFKEALVDQADQLGINVYDLEGNIDTRKLLDLALAEGEYGLRENAKALEAEAEALKLAEAEAQRLREAAIKLESDFAKNALEAAGWGNAISDAATDAGFSLEDAIANMEEALVGSAEFNADMLELQIRGLSEAGLQMVRDAGSNAPALAAALVDASKPEFDKFAALADKAALQVSDSFNEAKMDLINAWADGEISDATFRSLNTGLQNASNPTQLKQITTRINQALSAPILIKTDLDLKPAQETLNTFKSTGLSISAYARRYASGGFVSGPGGPRSDMVPAMLSNGEYVINARSTSRYKGLLEKINKDGLRFADGGEVSGTPIGSMGAGINITVNPSPGMNEKELAAAVSRQLAFEIRKGTI